MSNASDFFIDKGILKAYMGDGGTVVIPDGVRIIAPYVFDRRLLSLTVPKSVTHIVADVFRSCYNLMELTILGENVETSVFTFMGCTGLQKLVAPGVAWDALREAKLLRPAAIGYLTNSEIYTNAQTIALYQNYIVSQRKKLLPAIFRNDLVLALQMYAQKGKITAKDIDETYLQPALEAGATQCVAYLLEWSKKNFKNKDSWEF